LLYASSRLLHAVRPTAIYPLSLHDALPIFVAVEDRLPVLLLRASMIERGADGGNVAGRDAGGNAGHQLPSLIERFPSMGRPPARDRKSTRLNSSHVKISYAVFCLKKKNEHA